MVGGLVVASMNVAVVEVVVSGLVRMLIHACMADSPVITSRTSRKAVVLAPADIQLVNRTHASFRHFTKRVPVVNQLLRDARMNAGCSGGNCCCILVCT